MKKARLIKGQEQRIETLATFRSTTELLPLIKKHYKTTIFYKQEFEKSSEFGERLRLTIAIGLTVGGALVEQFMILRQD